MGSPVLHRIDEEADLSWEGALKKRKEDDYESWRGYDGANLYMKSGFILFLKQ